jgi:L-amino acid N-acyltransferase YncA
MAPRIGCTRLEAMIVAPPRPVPAVHVRALTAQDAVLLRRWTIGPEQFLRVEDLLACAEAPGTETLVGLDARGRLVAILQTVPAGCAGNGVRSVSLFVHPGRRRRGFGRATLLAALDEPRVSGSAWLAVVDRDNTASLRCFEACGFVTDARAAARDYEVLVRRSSNGRSRGAPKPYFATANVAR